MMNIMSMFLIIAGAYIFSTKRKHLLISLLSLEYMILGIFMMMFLTMNFLNFYFTLLFLTFSVCEGALGLSLLVSMNRNFGSDYFSTFNFN